MFFFFIVLFNRLCQRIFNFDFYTIDVIFDIFSHIFDFISIFNLTHYIFYKIEKRRIKKNFIQ